MRFYLTIMRYLNTKPIKMMPITDDIINDLSTYLIDTDKIPDILYLNQIDSREKNKKTIYIHYLNLYIRFI